MSYLRVTVDMRGRAYSTGQPDCNGWELYDVIDAVNYVRDHYSAHIVSPDVVYFESTSGGAGNALALAGKFPDFFAAIVALCPVSDYARWYADDRTGEFRDEMDVWIGTNSNAFAARSGVRLVDNLQTPLLLAHGAGDSRISVEQSRSFVAAARRSGKAGLVDYVELANCGGATHWAGATQEDLDCLAALGESHRTAHREVIEMPARARLVVGGYLVTKDVTIILDSIDDVATIEYDRAARHVAAVDGYTGPIVVRWHDR